jgi:hypothetical protein
VKLLSEGENELSEMKVKQKKNLLFTESSLFFDIRFTNKDINPKQQDRESFKS